MEQTQTAAEGASAVQICGDGNTVTIVCGGARLALQKLHTRRAAATTPIALLRTDVRATTFIGREAERRRLAAWRDAPQRVAVRCITGRAGAGKTRLAIEACEAAESESWAAGFAPSGELARFHATQNLVHWLQPKDVLIVIDYAATSLAVLKDWFAYLAPERDRREGGKLRILLLERQADPESGWWADLTRRESADRAGPADLVGNDALSALPALDAVADRRALLAEAMRLAAPLLEPPAVVQAPPLPGSDAWFDARLADDGIGNEPLYLMMAGVHAARHGAPSALALDHVELAGEMAEIETARLEKFARARGFTDGGELLKHVAACVTLQNGCAAAALPPLIWEEMAALQLAAPFPPNAIAKHLCDFLLLTAEAVDPIRPDLIGESFIVPLVTGGRFRSEDERRAIVHRCYRRSEAGTVDTLVRCARDLANGSADHRAILWLRAIIEASREVPELSRIAALLPQSTLAMREFAADVQAQIVSLLRAAPDQHGNAHLPQLAAALSNFGVRLRALGRFEAALAAIEEAVQLRRVLAFALPDAFTPDLAVSINNLANCLSTLGRREAALAAAADAVQL